MWFSRLRSSPVKKGLLFGIELEIEGSGIEAAASRMNASHWVTERDGSLRAGLEFKSRKAMNYNQCLEGIGMYSEFLDACSARATPRTSVHIHVNTQDLTVEQMKSFIWLSVAMEPVILRFCSDLRNHNAYCIPMYNSTNLVQYWRSLVQFLDGGEDLPQPKKYAATGAFRLYDLGTIEFRMFPGCTNPLKLRWYLDVLRSMYEVATSATVQTLRDKKLSDGLLSLITNVIVENRKSVSLTELERLIEVGIQMANDVFRKPTTTSELLAAYQVLFPSQYKPVTDTTLVDLFMSTSLKKELMMYDPDELMAKLDGKAFEVFKFLVQKFPDKPVKIANFVQELVKVGVAK